MPALIRAGRTKPVTFYSPNPVAVFYEIPYPGIQMLNSFKVQIGNELFKEIALQEAFIFCSNLSLLLILKE